MNTLRDVQPAGTSDRSGSNLEGVSLERHVKLDLEAAESTSMRVVKRGFDLICALAFFALFGWLYLLLVIGVWVSSGHPILYSQPRYGKGGRIFKFYKFRSMVRDADKVVEEHLKTNPIARKQWEDFQKLENDPRITKFGRFIRKTSLDELPQFWNVLTGDMSLVGPRPCMLSQKELYETDWAYYCAVRPGITGLWQVSGRNKLNYRARVALDAEYVASISFYKDIKILLRTFWVVASGHGSR